MKTLCIELTLPDVTDAFVVSSKIKEVEGIKSVGIVTSQQVRVRFNPKNALLNSSQP